MNRPIWKQLYEVALQLESEGNAPFTRKDLITGVQVLDPTIGPGTINPIIQGMTSNFQGGPGGSASRNLLMSVGRGKFVVASGERASNSAAPKAISAAPIAPLTTEQHQGRPLDGLSREIGGYAFRHVINLVPDHDSEGHPLEFLPQERYGNVNRLPLNKYGHGPFCSFRVPWDLTVAGVYAFVVDDQVRYVGECINFSQRFNMGYGVISPRNCYRGGQETNCRINNLVLEAVKHGSRIGLWFYQTGNYKAIERRLRATLDLAWNLG